MAHRNIHYEAAFEDYLRSRALPYVAVDETRKALFADAAVKSFDFLVYSSTGANLLADVKGRKFPADIPGRKRGTSRAYENWITREDADGLAEWQKVFGDDFAAVLVFAYWLQGSLQQCPFADVHCFRRRQYAFVGIRLGDYLSAARQRSGKWKTLYVPAAVFSRTARDIASFL